MINSVIGTIIILIRHGERNEPMSPNDDPHLNPAGLSRARLLIHVLGQANIKAIYTSEYIRTNEMAQPLAIELGLSPIKKAEAIAIKNHILSHHGRKTVLVVGHSDTVPELITLLGGTSGQEIQNSEFDNMFLATILSANQLAVVRLKYGERT